MRFKMKKKKEKKQHPYMYPKKTKRDDREARPMVRARSARTQWNEMK